MEPSPLLIEQRVRNRIIEYLEWVSEAKTAEDIYCQYELLVQWEDWVREPVDERTFPQPPYASVETKRLLAVHPTWTKLCDALPKFYTMDELLSNPEWPSFQAACSEAHRELMERGKLSEDDEESEA